MLLAESSTAKPSFGAPAIFSLLHGCLVDTANSVLL